MGTDIQNPMGTDGFEFVEFTALDTRALASLFERMGFAAIARHRHKDVVLYRQGDINFIVNHEPQSYAQAFARVRGPSACAFAFRVKDSARCVERAARLGARLFHREVGPMELNIPAIRSIGGTMIYLVDRYGERTIYDVDFEPIEGVQASDCTGAGLLYIDHLTHNVYQGRMHRWAYFYQRLFNFREIRYSDIHGHQTGLHSRAMISPCGKIRIPINEPTDERSRVQEFLEDYHGEGIQHIALATEDILASVAALRTAGIEFMDMPDAYYDDVDQRVPNHGLDLERMRRNRILIDGDPRAEQGLLLQIFTRPVIGPIFFELIQRQGNEGFGEGNFQALFEAISATR